MGERGSVPEAWASRSCRHKVIARETNSDPTRACMTAKIAFVHSANAISASRLPWSANRPDQAISRTPKLPNDGSEIAT